MGWDIDKEGNSDRGERLEPGTHEVEVFKVAKAKDTKAGDRQILVIFADDRGCEAAYFAPIEGKAAFKSAQLMKGLGYTTAMIDKAGLQPEHLLIEAVAKQWLVGNHCRIEVTPNGEYLNVRVLPPVGQPVERKAEPDAKPVAAAPMPDDDSPF